MSDFIPTGFSQLPKPPFPVRRFTVDEFVRLRSTGIIGAAEPVELLDGWLVPVVGNSLRHESALDKIFPAIGEFIPRGWQLRLRDFFATSSSVPRPDAMLVREKLETAAPFSPASEVGLIIEVSDASLYHDRRTKGRLYAAASVPNYWLLDLIDSQLEVYADPSGPVAMPGYRNQQTLRADDSLPVRAGDELLGNIRVGDLLP